MSLGASQVWVAAHEGGPLSERLKGLGLIGVVLLGGALAGAGWLWADRSLPADGARAVGVHDLFVTVALDAGDPTTLPSGGRRELPVRVWYPAEGDSHQVVADGVVDGPLAPLVVWTHDRMGSGADYESLARGLASRGHVVVMASHPELAREAEQSDGSVRTPSAGWAAVMSTSTDLLVVAGTEDFRRLMPLLQADQAALISAAAEQVPGLSLERIVYGGHGVGGALAVFSCGSDERCVAVVDFGGPPLLEQLPGGMGGRAVLMPPSLKVPFLSVVAENVLREPSSLPAMAALRAIASRSTVEATELVLSKAGYLDLSDRPLKVRPALLKRQHSGAYWVGEGDAAEGMEALRDVTAVFLEQHARRNGGVSVKDALEQHSRLRVR